MTLLVHCRCGCFRVTHSVVNSIVSKRYVDVLFGAGCTLPWVCGDEGRVRKSGVTRGRYNTHTPEQAKPDAKPEPCGPVYYGWVGPRRATVASGAILDAAGVLNVTVSAVAVELDAGSGLSGDSCSESVAVRQQKGGDNSASGLVEEHA